MTSASAAYPARRGTRMRRRPHLAWRRHRCMLQARASRRTCALSWSQTEPHGAVVGEEQRRRADRVANAVAGHACDGEDATCTRARAHALRVGGRARARLARDDVAVTGRAEVARVVNAERAGRLAVRAVRLASRIREALLIGHRALAGDAVTRDAAVLA